MLEEWKNDFWTFYDYVGPRPSPEHQMERINNDEGYFPLNVKWIPRSEQCRNRRITIFLTYNNVTLTTDQWAGILGCDVPTLTMRKKRGWDDRKIIETPIAEPKSPRKANARDRGLYRGKGLIAAYTRAENGVQP